MDLRDSEGSGVGVLEEVSQRICVCVCIYVYFNIYLSSIYQSSTYLSIYLPMHLSGDLEVLVHRVAGTCKSKIHSPGQQVDTQAGLAAGFR